MQRSPLFSSAYSAAAKGQTSEGDTQPTHPTLKTKPKPKGKSKAKGKPKPKPKTAPKAKPKGGNVQEKKLLQKGKKPKRRLSLRKVSRKMMRMTMWDPLKE